MQSILILLEQFGPMSSRELHDELPPMALAPLGECLRKLLRRGLIERELANLDRHNRARGYIYRLAERLKFDPPDAL